MSNPTREEIAALIWTLRNWENLTDQEDCAAMTAAANALESLTTRRNELEEQVGMLRKRHKDLRDILLWTEKYLRTEFKGLHLGRLKEAIAADDRAALEES